MSDPVVEEAYALLRRHTTGDLRFEEHLRPIKYVIAPDGTLIAPMMVAMLQALDTVLFVPEFAEGCIEVQLTIEPMTESGEGGALADRWRIHHGEPPDVNWGRGSIDAVRLREHVIDGAALTRPNPLAPVEPALCKWVNQERRADLAALCRSRTDVVVNEPVLVAVDPGGLDVRGRFDVHRVEAPEPMATEDDARRVIGALLDSAIAEAGADG